MKPYLVQDNGRTRVVEATPIRDAVKKWHAAIAREGKGKPTHDKPDSVSMICRHPVIR